MIPTRVIDSFFARQLNDSNRVKAFTEAALDAKLAALNPQPEFVTQPRVHQKASFLLGVKYPAYMMLLDPGLGKSKLSLDLAKYRMQLGQVKRTLVLVPNTSNIYSWKNQVAIHTPSLTVTGIDGSGAEEREEQWQSEAHITVSTYMGLLNRVCSPKSTAKVKKKDEKGWAVDEKKVKEIGHLFQMLVLDEITAAAGHQSLIHKVCRQLQAFCPNRVGLTGTPFGVNVEPLWGEFYLIDKGETLGETLGLFRACFFKEKANYFSPWPDYVFDKTKQDELNRVIRHRSIRYREEECLDLPPIVNKTIEIPPSVEQMRYYNSIMNRVKDEKGSSKALENIFHRLRMLSRGYLIVKDEETDEKDKVPMDKNPALDALLAAVDEVPLDRKIVIFHYYNLTGFSLAEALKKEKHKFVHLWQGSRDKQGIQKRFDEDPNCRIMLSSPSGAYGNNWQVANYLMMYETPSDPKMRLQEIARCHRDGQARKVFVTDFCVRKMIDQKILDALQRNTDLFNAIVNGREEFSD